MRVVIVEDEVKIRNGMAKLLSGYDKWDVIASARNGQEGFEVIIREKPELVITDIRMPVWDGLEMLCNLRAEGNNCHVVILTGYAEFEYAQRAMEYGVDGYLLKPVSVEDVELILQKAEKKIMREAMRIERTPDGILRGIIQGELAEEKSFDLSFLLSSGGNETKQYYLLCGLHDRKESDCVNLIFEAIKKLDCEKNRLLAVRSSDMGEIFVLVMLSGDSKEAIEYLKSRINRILKLYFKGRNGIWIYEKVSDMSELKSVADQIRNHYIYEIVLPENILIHLADITEYELPDFPYSLTLEKELKKQICFGSEDSARQWIDDLATAMHKKKYNPGSVQQAFIRIASFVINLTEEVFPEKRREVIELDTIRRMGHSVVFHDLYCLLKEQVLTLYRRPEDNNIRNYTIMRAIAYIREHFSERISQEDVAGYLNISPEYLSTLFHKEMNINFSAFINEFRISQAKRILKGSDMKVYEVAEKVGFSDPKYFNKVFKSIVGISPKEYREI